jgi:CheY-like chemotaxis protein
LGEFTLRLPLNVISQENSFLQNIPEISHKSDWKNKNILIIEDENDNYRFLHEILKNTSVKILWAQNGQEALRLYHQNHRFDLVLLDIKMPFMDGFSTFKAIKALAPNEIIVAQTAYARIEDELKIRDMGFSDYIAKPINPRHLIKLVSKYLSQ